MIVTLLGSSPALAKRRSTPKSRPLAAGLGKLSASYSTVDQMVELRRGATHLTLQPAQVEDLLLALATERGHAKSARRPTEAFFIPTSAPATIALPAGPTMQVSKIPMRELRKGGRVIYMNEKEAQGVLATIYAAHGDRPLAASVSVSAPAPVPALELSAYSPSPRLSSWIDPFSAANYATTALSGN